MPLGPIVSSVCLSVHYLAKKFNSIQKQYSLMRRSLITSRGTQKHKPKDDLINLDKISLFTNILVDKAPQSSMLITKCKQALHQTKDLPKLFLFIDKTSRNSHAIEKFLRISKQQTE